MESATPSGLAVVHRTVDPRRIAATTDATVEPAEVVSAEVVAPPTATPFGPQPWAGWPADWGPPGWSQGGNWWGRVEHLTDTAWMCLDRNASVIATMPPYLVGAAEGLDADWLNNPDPAVYGSWFQFAHQLVWDLQLGDAFVMPTDWYASGWPRVFHVMPPYLVRSEMRAGLPRHMIGNLDVTDEILQIPYQKRQDEARGHGPLEAGRSRVIAANALMRYATNLAASGGLPYALLVYQGRLTAKQASELKWQWVGERMASMGLPGVLSGGVDLKTLSFDPEKMALLDLSKFNEARIAYLLGVPAPLVGLPSGQDSMHYDNQLMARDDHWQSGLKPLVSRAMQALSGWALPRGTTVELNRDEYLRPALLERAQAWAILLQNGVVTAAEWREAERFSASAPTESLSAGVLQ